MMNFLKYFQKIKFSRLNFFFLSIGTLLVVVFISFMLGTRYDKISQKRLTRINPESIESIFFELKTSTFDVAKARDGEGGALTSFRNSLVLMTHDGRIFELEGSKLNQLEIALPDNGFFDLIKRSKTEYKTYNILFEKFRYNGIVYFEDADQAGFAVSYTEWNDKNKCYTNTVAHLPLPRNIKSLSELRINPSEWEIVFQSQPCLPLKKNRGHLEGHMAGGRIIYSGGNHVLLASGEYHFDGVAHPLKLSQDPNNDYGKVLEINLSNHAVKRIGLGLRNMQGILLDKDKKIWTVEHGPRGGDELNQVFEGGNYGWPEVTLGTNYNLQPWPTSGTYGRHDGYDQPIFSWLPSVGISSLTLIKNMHPAWDGDFVAGSLKAQSLFHIRIVQGRALFTEQINIGHRVRDVLQYNEGKLAVWSGGTKLIILEAQKNISKGHDLDSEIAALNIDKILMTQVKNRLETCVQCHSLNPTSIQQAPSLRKIYGAKIAASSYSNYSSALLSKGGNWTKDALAKFLTDVNSFAPGTSMPNQNISDPKELEALITLLSKL